MLCRILQVMGRLMKIFTTSCRRQSEKTLSKLIDATYLNDFNSALNKKKSYLIVRGEGNDSYIGIDTEGRDSALDQLPGYGESETTSENGIYLGGAAQALVRQVDFSV